MSSRKGKERAIPCEWLPRMTTLSGSGISNTNSKRGGSSYSTNVRGQQEGSGGSDGIVLPLQEVIGGEESWSISYTLPIRIGTPPQNVSLQVDTGSSDLWLPSSSCSSDPCTSGATRFDPSSSSTSRATNFPFHIGYLEGNVSGPVYWDTVELGGYPIDQQALAAADTVDNEPLNADYSGVLGLSLPLNSVIAQSLPQTDTDAADGAPVASNLFALTPDPAGNGGAPKNMFLGLALSRPGSEYPPALLGIGKHPSGAQFGWSGNDTLDNHVQWSDVEASSSQGDLYWKTGLRSISVWVDGQEKPVLLPQPTTMINGPYPSVILDSGVPLILGPKTLVDGVYGALSIGPGSDGHYYVPCTTPLNITVTLDDGNPVSLHPLDLTVQGSGGAASTTNGVEYCIGTIQAFTPPQDSPIQASDVILGVPFLRNVYTVLSFSNDSSVQAQNAGMPEHGYSRPRLGIVTLTSPSNALAEFNKVRVQKQPLWNQAPASNSADTTGGGKKKLSVGVEVLLGLVGFFVVCVLLFGLRWFMMWRAQRDPNRPSRMKTRVLAALAKRSKKGEEYEMGDSKGLYTLTPTNTSKSDLHDGLSEDELRKKRYENYLMRKRREEMFGGSVGTTNTDRTVVDSEGDKAKGALGVGENGKIVPDEADEMEKRTLAGATATMEASTTMNAVENLGSPPTSPSAPVFPEALQRNAAAAAVREEREHTRNDSVGSAAGEGAPLLNTSIPSPTLGPGVRLVSSPLPAAGVDDELGMTGGGMAGVGSRFSRRMSETGELDAREFSLPFSPPPGSHHPQMPTSSTFVDEPEPILEEPPATPTSAPLISPALLSGFGSADGHARKTSSGSTAASSRRERPGVKPGGPRESSGSSWSVKTPSVGS